MSGVGERARGAQQRGVAPRAGGGRVAAVAQHLLDRRGQHDVVAVLAEALGDRAGVARRPQIHRGAREAGPDAGRVDGRARHADQDARAAEAGLGRDHVQDLDVE